MALPPKILVIGPSWVGDIVMAQSLLKAIRAREPDAVIDMTGPDFALPLLARMPELRAGIAMPFDHGEGRLADRWAFGRGMRGQYDRAYVLPGSWKSALVPFAAGIGERIGYLKEQRWLLLNRIKPLPKEKKRKTVETFQALVDPKVFEDRARLHLPALRVDVENRLHLMQKYGLQPGQYVALMPGAEYGAAKRWPSWHYAELAFMLQEQGVTCVLFGSAKDARTADEILPLAPQAVDLTGKTTLADAIDLISGAKAAVSNDSGLMHIAAAVDVPVLGLFGSTSAEHTPPLSPKAQVVSLHLPCSPCNKRECPLVNIDCLVNIEPEQVLKLVEEC